MNLDQIQNRQKDLARESRNLKRDAILASSYRVSINNDNAVKYVKVVWLNENSSIAKIIEVLEESKGKISMTFRETREIEKLLGQAVRIDAATWHDKIHQICSKIPQLRESQREQYEY